MALHWSFSTRAWKHPPRADMVGRWGTATTESRPLNGLAAEESWGSASTSSWQLLRIPAAVPRTPNVREDRDEGRTRSRFVDRWERPEPTDTSTRLALEIQRTGSSLARIWRRPIATSRADATIHSVRITIATNAGDYCSSGTKPDGNWETLIVHQCTLVCPEQREGRLSLAGTACRFPPFHEIRNLSGAQRASDSRTGVNIACFGGGDCGRGGMLALSEACGSSMHSRPLNPKAASLPAGFLWAPKVLKLAIIDRRRNSFDFAADITDNSTL
jgi:hypothetical protein